MGFSPIGLAIALAVVAPNLLLLRWPPVDGFPSARIPGALSSLERAGQALCVVVPVITAPGPMDGWWAVPAMLALAAYGALWIRYLITGRTIAALYLPVLIPVPMAVLPVVVFVAGGLWLGNGWMAAAGLVLAAGHIPASVLIARAVRGSH